MTVAVGDRPVRLAVPPTYAAGAPAPLLIMLHGYGGDADREEGYFKLGPAAAAAGILYARPEGNTDGQGLKFWNATPACCDRDGSGVDDSAYLRRVITAIRSSHAVDPKRIFLVGASNGGFLAHRAACDHADLVAGIVSAAGAGALDAATCRPARPVSVLQIHGDADSVVQYSGGYLHGDHPGAVRTIADWAGRNGCRTATSSGPAIDLVLSADAETPTARLLDGAETKVTRHDGCRPGGHAELWTVTGGDHAPTPGPEYAQRVLDFLLAHPKP